MHTDKPMGELVAHAKGFRVGCACRRRTRPGQAAPASSQAPPRWASGRPPSPDCSLSASSPAGPAPDNPSMSSSSHLRFRGPSLPATNCGNGSSSAKANNCNQMISAVALSIHTLYLSGRPKYQSGMRPCYCQGRCTEPSCFACWLEILLHLSASACKSWGVNKSPYLIHLHGQARALGHMPLAVLARQQARGQRAPGRQAQAHLLVQGQIVLLHLHAAMLPFLCCLFVGRHPPVMGLPVICILRDKGPAESRSGHPQDEARSVKAARAELEQHEQPTGLLQT